MKINLFSEKNRFSEYLATDIKARDMGRCITFESFEAALSEKEAGDEVSFFLIKEDQSQNLRDMLKLAKMCGAVYGGVESAPACAPDGAESAACGGGVEVNKIRIYVFSSSDAARMIADSVECSGAEIILVDPQETAIWNFLYEHPVFTARDRLDDIEMRVLIIGKGEAVPAIIKNVYWCGRMRLFRMKMNMIGGNMAEIETSLKVTNPGLFTQTMQENIAMKERGLITPELFLPLRLTRAHYYQADTRSEDFEIALNECLESNYIIIDEGDDEETLSTAAMVRAHFIRKHVLHENFLTGGRNNVTKLPDIYVYIRNPEIAEVVPYLTVEGHKADPGNDELRLVPFGMEDTVYSADSIIDTKFEKMARELFPEEFAEGAKLSASNRRVLLASAMHLIYKLRDLNLVVKPEEGSEEAEIYNKEKFPEMKSVSLKKAREQQSILKYEMTALEHQQWTLLKLCDGWIPADAYHALGYSTNSKREHRQFAGKMSAACVESSALGGTGTKLYGYPSYFTEYDRRTSQRNVDAFLANYPDAEFVLLHEEDDD